jgi:hypothetical protein
MTADRMVAVTVPDDLEGVTDQLVMKQIKSRYQDKNKDTRFMVGVDRSKMRLYNIQDPHEGLVDENNRFGMFSKSQFETLN